MLVVFNPSDAKQDTSSSSNKNCTVLREGKQVLVKQKLYKVEDCQLQRAYQTCGVNLWHVINIVCSAMEVAKEKTTYHSRSQRFVREKLLSETCCLNPCTVTEMARYCP